MYDLTVCYILFEIFKIFFIFLKSNQQLMSLPKFKFIWIFEPPGFKMLLIEKFYGLRGRDQQRRNPALSPHLPVYSHFLFSHLQSRPGLMLILWNEMGLQRFLREDISSQTVTVSIERGAKEMAKGRKYPLAVMERKRNSSIWLRQPLLFKRRSLCSYTYFTSSSLQRWPIAVVKGRFQNKSSNQFWSTMDSEIR